MLITVHRLKVWESERPSPFVLPSDSDTVQIEPHAVSHCRAGIIAKGGNYGVKWRIWSLVLGRRSFGFLHFARKLLTSILVAARGAKRHVPTNTSGPFFQLSVHFTENDGAASFRPHISTRWPLPCCNFTAVDFIYYRCRKRVLMLLPKL